MAATSTSTTPAQSPSDSGQLGADLQGQSGAERNVADQTGQEQTGREQSGLQPVRAAWALSDPLLTDYYDTEWGMPVTDETGVFERLSLEGFQAGLSWLTVLKKREAFRRAFVSFDVDRVAAFDDSDVARLMTDPGIIKNRQKIIATITNARAARDLRASGTHLGEVVWEFMPERSPVPRTDAEVPATSAESRAMTKCLKKLGFTFVGPTTLYALMAAIGMVDVHLVGSHRRGCSGLWNVDGTRRTHR